MEFSVALQWCFLGGPSGAGAGIDLTSLSIVEGKICWDLYIDGLVVCLDGNLQDTWGAPIKASLSNTVISKVQDTMGTANDGHPELEVSDEEVL